MMSKPSPVPLAVFLVSLMGALVVTVCYGLFPTPVPMSVGLTLGWTPLAICLIVFGGKALHERLRAPDLVITVTARPTPLEAKFIEQDRRLERRERLRGEVFKNESEIETFAANLTPDERKAWQNRPGPFGKI